ncbi:H-NS histone family protein [Dyella sp. S184]|uniref:H-NS histone family protein n=1 Tax=Dyella sp. S184 TaxID=1641862 RepID=UPI00131B064B|nr:H-NS histone family protein [Dyella sp. S184]
MAIDLKALSPKELQALIANANAQMKEAHGYMIQDVRKKIDALLKLSGLTLGDVYPTRGGGKKAAGKKGSTGSVAPKYRDPSDPSQTWSGRGRQPFWFAAALKKRGVTAETLLIGGATKATSTKKAPVKKAKKPAKPKV